MPCLPGPRWKTSQQLPGPRCSSLPRKRRFRLRTKPPLHPVVQHDLVVPHCSRWAAPGVAGQTPSPSLAGTRLHTCGRARSHVPRLAPTPAPRHADEDRPSR
ncbi:hypothetical protein T484DRAFT_1927876 [Baffinella frigidus]|nr:hypothetical protein T484DRAFT_1927876 [Cryptophyta sp. CCMP2293]